MGQLNNLALISTVVIAVAFILIIVGFATTGWTELGGYIHKDFDYQSDTVKATAALVIIGFLAAIVALISIVVFMVFGVTDNLSGFASKLPLVALVASIVGAVFSILGCIIFAAEYYDLVDPDYSFFLTIIGGIVLVIGGVIAYKSKSGGIGTS